MAKPTSLPRWATGGTALVTEPTEGQKDSGWAPLQKPPAQYFNWWKRTVYLWCAYLDGLTSEALTWAAKHTFSAGLASGTVPTASSTDVARMVEVTAETNARIAADALRPLDTAVVHNTGAEAVAGVKTFSSSPVVPTPAAGTDAANKSYADAREVAAKAYADALQFALPTPTQPTLSAFTHDGSRPVRYWKDRNQVVHLMGLASANATGSNQTLFTLPAGFRPAAAVGVATMFPIMNITDTLLAKLMAYGSTGSVVIQNTTAGKYYALDGITFLAEG